jgi:TolA-binding protein
VTKDERRTQVVSEKGTGAQKPRVRSPFRTGALAWMCPWLICLATGCVSADWLPWKKNDSASAAAGPKDSLVMRGTGLERDRIADSALEADLEAAKRLYQNKEYRKAEAAYHKIANNKKAPINVADEALYFEADCQRAQNNLRDAEGTFRKYVKEFRVNGQYVEQANRRLFEIANYWLDDTRQQMQAYEEQREGKRWFVLPASYVHFSKDRPLFDMEGHALQLLDDVSMNDIRGSIRPVDGGPSLGERAMFFVATVKFFREDYHEADYYYSQLYENHPNSPLAPKAIKQSIICKQVMNGGTAYDTRVIEESRKLIDRYQGAYPDWTKDRDWLSRQLGSIHLQQADRDYKIGEFYRRTGHPGSAYFYYELVRRRYPNTEYAKQAEDRMRDLRGLAEREQGFAVTSTAPVNAAPISPMSPNAFTPAPVAMPAPSANPANMPGAFVPPAATTAPNVLPAPTSTAQPLPPSAAPEAGSQPPTPMPIAPSTTPSGPYAPTPRLLPPAFFPGSN